MKAQSTPRAVLILFLVFLAITARADTPPDAGKLTSANTGFAFKLLQTIAREQPATNIFISPYSVSTVLQMIENGAGGKTKAELRQALGIAELSQSAQNTANRELNRSITATTTNLVLNTANGIWVRRGLQVEPAFVACNQDFYQATVEALDFSNPAAVHRINSWVKEQTRGKIPSILSGPMDPTTSLYLANAVYFKGDWDRPFKTEDTKDREFHLRTGKTKKLPLMFQGGHFSYRKGTGYQAVRLPYQGWNVGMYVFLPDADSSPEKLLAIMNGDNWRRVTVPGFKSREGTLGLPRLKLEYEVDLKPSLHTLGIRNAFSPAAADFSALCGEPTFVSGAKQKSFVEINERGTEAAAVTGIEALPASIVMERPKPFEMIVDRPFLFVIEHSQSQTILFMGIIFDPSLEG